MGFYVFMKQMKAIGFVKKKDYEMSINSKLFVELMGAFDLVGDRISLQYGGSVAHHQHNKKKGFMKLNALPELLTSIKRHISNNFFDEIKQRHYNLFLGKYIPGQNRKQLWEYADDEEFHYKKDTMMLEKINGNWWENPLREYE